MFPASLSPRASRLLSISVFPVLLLAGCSTWDSRESPRDPAPVFQRLMPLADAALAAGQLEVARRLCTALAREFSSDPAPLLCLGDAYLAGRDLALARDAFTEAHALAVHGTPNPVSFEPPPPLSPVAAFTAQLGLAQVDAASGFLPDAAARLRDLGSPPDVPVALRVRAHVLHAGYALERGTRSEASSVLRRAAPLAQHDPVLYAPVLLLLSRADDPARVRNLFADRPPGYWTPPVLERLGSSPVFSALVDAYADPRPGPDDSVSAAHALPAPPPGRPGGLARIADLPLPGSAPAPAGPFGLVASDTLALGEVRTVSLLEPAVSVLAVREDVVDVHLTSPTSLHILARGPGRSEVVVESVSGERLSTAYLVVQDDHAASTFLASLPEAGSVHLEPLSHGVALSGVVDSPARAHWIAERVAALLPADLPMDNSLVVSGPQQVELEVSIAEMRREVSEELGFQWDRVLDKDDPQSWWRLSSAGRLTAQFWFPPSPIRVMIDALSQAGLANILASPTLVALSGEQAVFNAGERVPLLREIKDDGDRVYVYEPLGVSLAFVPVVHAPGRISVSVHAAVDEQSGEVFDTFPTLQSRSMQTTVEVADGASFVVAGLFRSGSSQNESGIPGLKDLPLLGILASGYKTAALEQELVIAVTARLVSTAVSPARVPSGVSPSVVSRASPSPLPTSP